MTAHPRAITADGVCTTCPYCGVGCGVLATPDGRGGASIKGDPLHPANAGRLCSKGSALGETLGLETRLLTPMIGAAEVSWQSALDHTAAQLRAVRDAHGPDAIAFYLSGQLLTEDYYVANKLAKGFIGTPHVDTNSRLCMASSVAGHRRAFGADVVPQCYDDLELADLIVLVGSNAAWCHPILYQRMQMARGERGVRVVNIDPRRTATSEGCDLHLGLRPGSDIALWNGLLVRLAECGQIDRQFVRRHTSGYDDALAAACAEVPDVAAVARATGIDPASIETFYGWFTSTPRAVSCYSQGVNQSVSGTDTVNAIINCHLASGRIGRVGSGPLSLTGQPNAMGGREVGGLANMLAAHMGFSAGERDIVRRFWSAPDLVTGEGLKAVAMFDAIAAGRIKALWVMGTNPAVSLPAGAAVRRALAKLDLLIVSENVANTDTARAAHVRLPAAAWGEKDGTVTNSERRISRQRAFLPLPGGARPDWWIMAQIAHRFGWGTAFVYDGPAAIFREHARLSAFENEGTRAFDIGALADLDRAAYDAFQPRQWPVRAGEPEAASARLFAEGGFFTPDRRARLVPVASRPAIDLAATPWPFVLNTGRIRDQWHTMTRTGLSPRLSTHIAEPFVELHPSDAAELGLEQGTLARVESRHGAAVLRVLVSQNQQRGSLFVPIHWSDTNSSDGGIGQLVQPDTDPISGQPDSKATPARIAAHAATHFGYLLVRDGAEPSPMVAGFTYWARARTPFGSLINFALDRPPLEWPAWLDAHLPPGERLLFDDPSQGVYRAAVLDRDRLAAVVMIGPRPQLPSPDWLRTQFAEAAIPRAGRQALLAGRAIDGAPDDGPVVCVCFQVGAQRIAALAVSGRRDTAAIGSSCGAGTNCGSCIPEIRRILAAQSPAGRSPPCDPDHTGRDPTATGV